MRSFFVASSASATSEKPFCGSWNRLLNTMFPPDTVFEISPQFPVNDRDSVDFVVTMLIHVNAIPVFFVEVKPPADVSTPSKRERADLQMRQRFVDCRQDLKIDTLYGVSALGTKLAFYQMDKATGALNPAQIQRDLQVASPTAPREWWEWDIVEEAGATKFKGIVADVKKMCEMV